MRGLVVCTLLACADTTPLMMVIVVTFVLTCSVAACMVLTAYASAGAASCMTMGTTSMGTLPLAWLIMLKLATCAGVGTPTRTEMGASLMLLMSLATSLVFLGLACARMLLVYAVMVSGCTMALASSFPSARTRAGSGCCGRRVLI